MGDADRTINPNRSMTRRTRRLKSDLTAVLLELSRQLVRLRSGSTAFHSQTLDRFSSAATQVDVDNVEGVKLF